jgi:hypothetical protein
MISKAILGPAAVLVAWSLVVMVWMAASRFSAVRAANRDKLRQLSKPGVRGADLEGILPPASNWASHNYTHLVEQPTLFYATVLILALAGAGDGLNLSLAWGYVGLRIAHSLWQIMINTLPVRFVLFGLSSLCLATLASMRCVRRCCDCACRRPAVDSVARSPRKQRLVDTGRW